MGGIRNYLIEAKRSIRNDSIKTKASMNLKSDAFLNKQGKRKLSYKKIIKNKKLQKKSIL